MTSFDYLVLAILLISVLLGLMRGLIKEVLSFAHVVAFGRDLVGPPRLWLA